MSSVDSEHNILMSTTSDINNRSVLVHLQSKTTKFRLQSMQEQQAVNREHRSSLYKAKTIKSHILLPRYYRRRCSPSHGNPVRRDPVPAVLPWMWSPLPRYSRGYRGIPAVPITVQTSNTNTSLYSRTVSHFQFSSSNQFLSLRPS